MCCSNLFRRVLARLRPRTLASSGPDLGRAVGAWTLVLLFAAPVVSQEGQVGEAAQKPPPTTVPAGDQETLARQLAGARARLASLPAAEDPMSADGRRLQAWQRRVQLLEEVQQLVGAAESQKSLSASLPSRLETAHKENERLASQAVVSPPAEPTKAGYDALDAQVNRQDELVAAKRDERAKLQQHAEQIPQLLSQARDREAEAVERQGRLSQDLAAATDPVEKEILETRIENAVQEALCARMTITNLDREAELARDSDPVLGEELDAAERELDLLRQQAAMFSEALSQRLLSDQERLERELARHQQELAAAQGPAERALAGWRTELARSELNAGTFNSRLLALNAELDDQQRKLQAETEELKSLREYMKRAGAGEAAADRIKFTLKRVQLRRQALKQTLDGDRQDDLRARRFELEDRLFGLKEAWQQQVDAVAAELPTPAAVVSFRAEAGALFEPFRAASRQERDVLAQIIAVGQQLQVTGLDRRNSADELEAFIRSRVFWIRDARPLGPELLPRLQREVGAVGGWLRSLGSTEVTSQVVASLSSVGALLSALLLFAVLPFGLFRVRQWLRRFVTRQNDRTLRRDASVVDRLLAVLAGVLSVAILPTYLLVAAEIVSVTGLVPAIALVVAGTLRHAAVFLFVWFLSRSFFAGRGTAQVQFGMDEDASHAVHRSLGIALVGYSFYAVRDLLSRPPFALDGTSLEVLPRLAFTVFLILEVVAAVMLLRPRSAFSRRWRESLGSSWFGRSWGSIAGALCIAAVGLTALEVAGYRYGSHVVGSNLALSVVTMFVLVAIRKGVVFGIESYARGRRARHLPRVDSDAEQVRTGIDESQIRRFTGLVFLVLGLLVIASIWGVDERAFGTLDEWVLFDIRDSGDVDEYLSAGDLIRLVLFVVGTWFTLKILPGIYEYAIFPKLRIDSGLKYAILTISRYGVFTVGVFLALAAIHLDLGRLSWLMAAVGVGLGFGLQEIVSNFVSGIILLVERPVRVGDVVTVGAISGRVQRINIRATTVLNFDRQEIIIPNRSLITQDVTNWTRGDTIIRLVVPIGVAYGSDIDDVTNLLLKLAHANPDVLRDPEPQALFLNHGASSLDFELRVFVPDPSVKLRVQHALNRSISLEFASRGIEIPFPQQDVHIRSSDVGATSVAVEKA